MNKKILILIFGIFFVSLVSSLTLDELINFYSFDYNENKIDFEISDSLIDSNVLSFNLEVFSAVGGIYDFYIDLEDSNSLVSGFNRVELLGGENFQVNISTYYLSGKNEFNYSLRIYEDGSLIYLKDKMETDFYSDYDLGYEILGVEDYYKEDSLILNISINSSSNTIENISVFLNFNNRTFVKKIEENLKKGINYIVFEIGGEDIFSSHYVGMYNVSRILIGEKFIELGFLTSEYDFRDFGNGSYIERCEIGLVEGDLIMEFLVDAKDGGVYSLVGGVYDLEGEFLGMINMSEKLSEGSHVMRGEIDGELFYSLGLNGPYVIKYSELFFNGSHIDFVEDLCVSEEIYYEEFRKPTMADLKLSMDVREKEGGYNLSILVENIGEVDAFDVYVDLFDEDYSEKIFAGDLGTGESREFIFELESINLDFFAVVDFYDLIEEVNEENNFISYRKVGMPGDDDLLVECLSYYSGEDSFNIIDSFRVSSFQNNKSWYAFSSLLDGIKLIGNLGGKAKENRISCYLDLNSIVLPGKELFSDVESKKQFKMYLKKNVEGDLRELRGNYNFRLSDGMHVIGMQEYDSDGNFSSGRIRCMNKGAEKECQKDCEGKDCKKRCFELYDIKKSYGFEGKRFLSIYDVLDECNYF